MEKVVISREHYDKLVEELAVLKGPKRVEAAENLSVSRAHGDLKENAEYDAAKEAKAHLETKIAQIEATLSSAQILDTSQTPKDKAYLGATVTVQNFTLDEEFVYRLVSVDEADFEAGKIAITSPVGKALLGKAKGEEMSFTVPAGTMKLKILNIQYE